MCLLSDDDRPTNYRPQMVARKCPKTSTYFLEIPPGYALPFITLTTQVATDVNGDGVVDAIASVGKVWEDTNRNGVADHGDVIRVGQFVLDVLNDVAGFAWGPRDMRRVVKHVARQESRNLTPLAFLRPTAMPANLMSVRR